MAKNYIAHHGIKGQKWGVRRFQNEDGTYTEAGKKRRKFEKQYANSPDEVRKYIAKYVSWNTLASSKYEQLADDIYLETQHKMDKYEDKAKNAKSKEERDRWNKKAEQADYEFYVKYGREIYKDLISKYGKLAASDIIEYEKKQGALGPDLIDL